MPRRRIGRGEIAALVGLLVLLTILGRALTDPALSYCPDYVQYWAAARLNATGGNPYDPQQLLALEAPFSLDEGQPIVMYNPVWTLALVAPFGVMGFYFSRLIWMVLEAAVLTVCAAWAWRYYGGFAPERKWAFMLCWTFFPCLIAVGMGQISPLILLGLVGFLHFEGRRDWLAGASTVLVAVKPQVAYLFWPCLVLWAIDRRRWSVLVGGALAGLIATGIPLAMNPYALAQYRDLVVTHPPSRFLSPTFGTFLRLWWGWDSFWLQFLPSLVGFTWLAWYWLSRRRRWRWGERLPAVLFASVLTAPYGAWPFDWVAFLLAAVQTAVQIARRGNRPIMKLAIAVHVSLSILMGVMWFAVLNVTGLNKSYHIVFPVIIAGIYLLFLNSRRGRTESRWDVPSTV